MGFLCLFLFFGFNGHAQTRLSAPNLALLDQLLDLFGSEAADWNISNIDSMILEIIGELERVERQYDQYSSDIGPFETTSGAELSSDPTFGDLEVYALRHRAYIDRLSFERRRAESDLLRASDFAEFVSELRMGVTEQYNILVSNPVTAGLAAPVVQGLQQTVHVHFEQLDNKAHSLRAGIERYFHNVERLIVEEEPLLETFEANLETIRATMEVTKKHCGTVKSPKKCPKPESGPRGQGLGGGGFGATGGVSQ